MSTLIMLNGLFLQMTATSLSTAQIIFRISAIVSSVEFLIMLMLGSVGYASNIYIEAAMDIILLALFSTPLIFLLIVRPFVRSRDDAYKQLNHLALTDSLTQLPNRRCIDMHLQKTIAGMQRRPCYGAILLLDLDEFKQINDVHGHDAGDHVLVTIANRLRSRVRSEDVTARLGGDEFVVLLNHLDEDARKANDIVAMVAEKLIIHLSKVIKFNDANLKVGVSIGIRLIGIEDTESTIAIKEADIAMFRAKKQGKGRSAIFDPATDFPPVMA